MTNFEVGLLNGGYDTCYGNQFAKRDPFKKITIGKEDKNKLESSHWDHSRSWS
jgi:hypothetical protein